MAVAILGGEAEISTLDGSVMLNIPQGTQNGRVFRLGGKGMPRLANAKERGDLFARVRVVLPEDLSDEELELVRRLHDLRPSSNPRSGSTASDDPTAHQATADGQRNDSVRPERGDA